MLKWQLGPGLTCMRVFGQYLQQTQGSSHGLPLETELAVWPGRPECRGDLVPLSECWGEGGCLPGV